MIKKFISLLIAIVALDAALFAQEAKIKSGEGTMTLSKKTYQLSHAVAYESATAGEGEVAVVLSASPVSAEKLKKSRAAEKEGSGFGDFPSPYLRLVFSKTGELKNWSASGGGTTIGGASDGTGELKLDGGHATGKAIAAVQADATIPKGFDVKFDVALLKSGDELPASTAKKYGPAANVKPTVTGTFKGDGKNANLTYVSARWGEPFDGKPGIVLVFTEKDHSKAQKPDFDASFGKFGSALVISLHDEGEIYGCEVRHNAMQKKGFSSIGNIETTGFTYADGKVEGELTTNGPAEFFGETWEVQLKFVAPLGEIPKESQVAESSKPEAKQTTEKSESDESDQKEATKPAASGLNAKDLALTKDASDIEYKALVEQLSFKSKLPVKSACTELAKNLKAQGWTGDGSDLVNPKSSILKRKRGEASLTIFVKPENEGSVISMMTEGLSWDGE